MAPNPIMGARICFHLNQKLYNYTPKIPIVNGSDGI